MIAVIGRPVANSTVSRNGRLNCGSGSGTAGTPPASRQTIVSAEPPHRIRPLNIGRYVVSGVSTALEVLEPRVRRQLRPRPALRLIEARTTPTAAAARTATRDQHQDARAQHPARSGAGRVDRRLQRRSHGSGLRVQATEVDEREHRADRQQHQGDGRAVADLGEAERLLVHVAAAASGSWSPGRRGSSRRSGRTRRASAA